MKTQVLYDYFQPEAPCSVAGTIQQRGVEPIKYGLLRSAELKGKVHARGHNIERARREVHGANVHNTIRIFLHDEFSRGKGKRACAERCIAPVVHGRRAGMVRASQERQAVGPYANDGGDDSYVCMAALQALSLFDMKLEISKIHWATRQ